ncbi:hypothetical protein EW145_g8580, partial [Phellinidium pouzarii]
MIAFRSKKALKPPAPAGLATYCGNDVSDAPLPIRSCFPAAFDVTSRSAPSSRSLHTPPSLHPRPSLIPELVAPLRPDPTPSPGPDSATATL